MSSTYAVVVTFFPVVEQLHRLCAVLQKSASIVVVDNTPKGEVLLPYDLCTWVANGENLGIAKAQNIGIREAIRLGAKSIAFFDQDSQPNEFMLPVLISALSSCDVAAPVCVDTRTGFEYPPFRFNDWGWASPVATIDRSEPVDVNLIISSGSVVAAEVFQQVGLMEEDFFIDYVDLEWCIRCCRAGFSIQVIPSVTMPHSIGNKVVNTGAFTTFVHSPLRTYYRVRNPFLLLRMQHVPRLFAIHEIAAALVHHLLQWRHSQNRSLHLRMGWRGLFDGLRGRRGRSNLA
jgi:rhamnosyltransferase